MSQLDERNCRHVQPAELSHSDWVSLWWGMFWRSLIIVAGSTAVSAGLGMVTGALAGLLIVLAGGDVQRFMLPLQIVGGLLGLAVGVAFFPVWVKWLIRARFGRLRLGLFEAGVRDQEPRASDPPVVRSTLGTEAETP